MNVTVTGRIVDVLPMQRGTSKRGNEWVSQEYILEDFDKEEIIGFRVFGEKAIEKYELSKGSIVAVVLKIESRVWEDKTFTTLNCIECYKNVSVEEKKRKSKKENNDSGRAISPDDLPW